MLDASLESFSDRPIRLELRHLALVCPRKFATTGVITGEGAPIYDPYPIMDDWVDVLGAGGRLAGHERGGGGGCRSPESDTVDV